MKLFKVILIGLVLIASSCSKDDDAKPSLEKQTISFLEAEEITPPAAMLASTDPNAQEAAGWISAANIMSQFASYFEAPSGSKSASKITASNGRTGETGDFATYVWSDENSGWSFAYQISEKSDRYVFEIFMKTDPASEWLKYVNVEEKKDRSEGSMKVYDIFEITGDPSTVLLAYNWTRAGDILTLTINDYSGSFTALLVLNEKTKAGSVVYNVDGQKYYEMSWNSAGDGSYTYYDSAGNIEMEGTWDV